ncbi:uncharacterized protein LOC111714375 [Eurytemora carolleeae]|uniref:uncharacterized protein LOC111714375 n=1 Tax=Eurytemora carolleeae TaxID=1294199 RepID=UPI000C76BA9D|nr:uncharacterized protein LOC111714375 [Eurytemora carolleeae]|eukprot:XP_023345236.1 uncharacterized protein LOC111714375 [Eurytemora affinis]
MVNVLVVSALFLVGLAQGVHLGREKSEFIPLRSRAGVTYYGIDTETSQVILEDIKNNSNSFMDRSLGCGECLSNLKIGQSGVIESPVGESINNCVWLLHTETDAEISLTCDIINLPNCLTTGDPTKIPTWSDILIISSTWKFTDSRVYCGQATDRLGYVHHISTCNRMALVFRSEAGLPEGYGFKCRWNINSIWKK